MIRPIFHFVLISALVLVLVQGNNAKNNNEETCSWTEDWRCKSCSTDSQASTTAPTCSRCNDEYSFAAYRADWENIPSSTDSSGAHCALISERGLAEFQYERGITWGVLREDCLGIRDIQDGEEEEEVEEEGPIESERIVYYKHALNTFCDLDLSCGSPYKCQKCKAFPHPMDLPPSPTLRLASKTIPLYFCITS